MGISFYHDTSKKVSEKMERRAERRYDCEVIISCSYFNRNQTFHGRVLNYSESGIYFECPSFFKEKSVILIKSLERLSISAPGDVYCAPRTVSLAEVKWYKKMSDTKISRYAMGAGYL